MSLVWTIAKLCFVILMVHNITLSESSKRSYFVCKMKCKQHHYDCRHQAEIHEFTLCTRTLKICSNLCKAKFGGPRFLKF